MHRWFQFSLRSLLMLTVFVAVYCAGWRSSRWHVERELDEARRVAVEEARAEWERPKTLMCFSSGSLHSIPFTIDPNVWHDLGLRNDGKAVELPP